MAWLLHAPAGTVLNVNVPDLPDRAGAGRAGGAARPLRHGGGHHVATGGQATRRGRTRSSSAWARRAGGAGASDAGTDAALLAAGFVTVTCIVGVRFGGMDRRRPPDQRGPSVS